MNRLFLCVALMFYLVVSTGVRAQINIVNIPVQPFNLTSDALLNVNIMNGEGEKQVQLLTQLYNSANSVLLTVKSQAFKLTKGLNSGLANRKVESAVFSSVTQATYLKTTHNLASGRYKLCSMLLIEDGSERTDELCEEMEADFNQYLYLVNPLDGDTIDSKYPILSWTHSEPFSLLNQGESYRMIVSEMKKDQSAEEAVTVNTPVMVKTTLKEHQLQYPYDARELKPGCKYAWQVQKLTDGIVINKTEAWMFNVRAQLEVKSVKYVALKNKLDGSFYNALDGFVYFKFSEEYKSPGQLNYTLTDNKSRVIDIEIKKDKNTIKNECPSTAAVEMKAQGDNRYELNLNGKKLAVGFYTLEIKNEKNESFYLKIFLP